MKILITNDDGIMAGGIHALARELMKKHEVIIVAPREQQSAKSHAITLHSPITVRKEEIHGLDCEAYSIDGTPADCARFGMDMLSDGVDMVVSGINRGYNIGTDVIYSGTVSAAMEAAIYGVPSIAVSLEIEDWGKYDEDYSLAAKYALRIIEMAEKKYIMPNVVLNVNVPCLKEEDIKGLKVCKIGERTYTHSYIKIEKGENPEAYSVSGTPNKFENSNDDITYLQKGYVTLTPLHYDLTNFKILNDTKKIFNEGMLKDV